MNKTADVKAKLMSGQFDEQLAYLYACDKSETKKYADRYIEVIDGLEEIFGAANEVSRVSAPGRTEIGGNHTDHQHGCILAGSVNLDVIAAVKLNGTNQVRIKSQGYDMDVVDLDDLEKRVLDDGNCQASSDVANRSAFLLRLLNAAVHENGAACAQIHGIFREQSLICELFGGVTQ